MLPRKGVEVSIVEHELDGEDVSAGLVGVVAGRHPVVTHVNVAVVLHPHVLL